jgi:hypothetical protein
MDQFSTRGHCVTAEINVPWELAFDYLKEPMNLGDWALGCRDVKKTEESGLYSGNSIFDGKTVYFSIKAYKDIPLIDFLVGERNALQPRISVRLVPGPQSGNDKLVCLLSLSAWRNLDMDDARWHQLCVCHETEIILLKSLLEKPT